jgi:nucleotide-binding universal stress UspA family protein
VISAYGNQEIRTLRAGGEVVQINQVDTATRVANDVAESLRAEFPNVTIKSDAALGQPGEALVSTAADLNADLIVVGNKRVQGFSRVLGSIARDVASEAHCDVYIAYTR